MAKQKGESIHKESDRMTSLGNSVIYKMGKKRDAIAKELEKDGVKEAVMAYIFSGDPEAISPLQEIHDAHK
jgi:hypothetical protein